MGEKIENPRNDVRLRNRKRPPDAFIRRLHDAILSHEGLIPASSIAPRVEAKRRKRK